MSAYVGVTSPVGLKFACRLPTLESEVQWTWTYRPKGELGGKEKRRLMSAVNAVQIFVKGIVK